MGRPVMIYKKKARSFVNFMANEIFRSVQKKKKRSLLFDFNFCEEFIRLKISIQYDSESLNPFGFTINGHCSDEDIEMIISISIKTFTKQRFDSFHAELREFLRHELEHVAQHLEIPGKADMYGYDAIVSSLNRVEYFTRPYEVDAFLYGLNYKRKYLKTNIVDEIDYLLNEYYQLIPEEVKIIKDIWIKRLKELLPHTIND